MAMRTFFIEIKSGGSLKRESNSEEKHKAYSAR